jgi:two-component system OmpR family sensor kinase
VRVWREAPLWLRLVTSLLLLAALALLVNGLVGTRLLRGYLVQQVDGDLAAAIRSASIVELPDVEFPTPYYLALLDADAGVVGEIRSGLLGSHKPDLSELTHDEAMEREGRAFTVDTLSGPGNWRVLAVTRTYRDVSGPHDITVALATSLDDVDDTVRQLRFINLLVGVFVLGGLAVAGYAMVRSALRRLEEMERTAGAIAGGDLARRVVDADASTEVGRLGLALNVMLDQIETAFREGQASEGRAVESEARMRQFVADASHELRTPLTSIRGFAELYRQGAASDPAATADLLGRIEGEATRMGVLVDDLLLLARLDQQRPLARAPVDLVALARDATDAARLVARDREITLVTGEESLVVTGDEARLRQVVGNLVDNALTHTPAGTPVEVRVTTERIADRGGSGGGGRGEGRGGPPGREGRGEDREEEREAGGGADDGGDAARPRDRAVLAVRDEGPGLTPEQSARVFERFYRTDAARSRPGGGAGLGLSIVAAIAAAHGGWAEVDSTPGEGTTFRVVLPRGA